MSTININPKALAGALRGEGLRVRRALPKAAYAAALRFAGYLADQTDARGITDRGLFKAGWRAVKTLKGASVHNDAPYAGVLELGARPHKVGRAAREAIAAWAVRKLGLAPDDAMRAAWAIGAKIQREGQKPTYMVRDSLPKAAKFFGQEMNSVLRQRSRKAAAS